MSGSAAATSAYPELPTSKVLHAFNISLFDLCWIADRQEALHHSEYLASEYGPTRLGELQESLSTRLGIPTAASCKTPSLWTTLFGKRPAKDRFAQPNYLGLHFYPQLNCNSALPGPALFRLDLSLRCDVATPPIDLLRLLLTPFQSLDVVIADYRPQGCTWSRDWEADFAARSPSRWQTAIPHSLMDQVDHSVWRNASDQSVQLRYQRRELDLEEMIFELEPQWIDPSIRTHILDLSYNIRDSLFLQRSASQRH